MARLHILALLFIVTFSFSACGGSEDPSDPQDLFGQPGQQPTGANFLRNFPVNLIEAGGPPKDAIPALTDPEFVDASSPDAWYVAEGDLVLGVAVNGEAKAYPHNIGWWHEIVNDVVGGQPIVVSFCPLTSTGLVFDGEGGSGERITTGVSGLLFNNNLIMYDRRDGETLYPQMIFRGVMGPRTGEDLALMPVVETTWAYWKKLYPNTKVISGLTNVYPATQYTEYPYGGYRFPGAPPIFQTYPDLDQNAMGRLYAPKEMALGVRFDETAKAYPFAKMGDTAVINDTVAGTPLVVVWYADGQMAIPYLRRVSDRELKFEKAASSNPAYPFMLKDEQTGTAWNLKGEAIDGELKGSRLTQIPAHNAFWFAWATFWQDTAVY